MLFRFANSKIHVKVLESGALIIRDTERGTEWGSRIPGWATLSDGKISEAIPLSKPSITKKSDNSIRVEFGNLRSENFGDTGFSMSVDLNMSEDYLDLEIIKLGSALKLVNVEYPAHLFTVKSGVENGYIAVPIKQGAIIPSRLDAGFMRFLHNTWRAISDIERVIQFDTGGINMPWFGAASGNSAIFAYVMTSADCALHVIGNAVVGEQGFVVDARHGQNPGERISSLCPVWMTSCGGLGYTRKLRIELVDNGYVGMAKRYRQYSKESGRYVSLKQKIEENPLVERIVGAPDIKIYIYTNRPNTPYYRSWSEPVLNGYSKLHTTFEQVAGMASDLKNAGIDRSLILLGGWNKAGYDREHVDMWPPAEQAGGAEGLAQAGKSVSEQGFLFSLHDNYQDFYTEAPSYDERYIMKHEDGSVKLGGVWDGGHCRLICSSRAIELAERNLDLVQSTCNINSYYVDTTTAAGLYECYDKSHPITRSDDRQNKFDLLKFLNGRRLVVGGEGGTDWAVPVCSFFEGLPGSSIGLYGGVESVGFGLVAPLFNLVYHDAVVCYWQHGQPFGREDHANHVLHDLMSGQPSSWSIVYDQWEDLKPLIKQTYELLAAFHRRTAHHPMVLHQYLTPDYSVHKTLFGEGSEVIVNFGITSFETDGVKLPPKGFCLKVPGQMVKIGAMNRDISYR